ncbi:hypothetical protein B2J93_1024 [Marssonina coronariae]|uniref:Uncharacterized protein n=1 Tax=Diplocarpon coronariae TaxID=2795749 RepID=A0A218Z4U3_9HELO|nr:hypothetical protein B2J93_1024 [Marssonina coronariae]
MSSLLCGAELLRRGFLYNAFSTLPLLCLSMLPTTVVTSNVTTTHSSGSRSRVAVTSGNLLPRRPFPHDSASFAAPVAGSPSYTSLASYRGLQAALSEPQPTGTHCVPAAAAASPPPPLLAWGEARTVEEGQTPPCAMSRCTASHPGMRGHAPVLALVGGEVGGASARHTARERAPAGDNQRATPTHRRGPSALSHASAASSSSSPPADYGTSTVRPARTRRICRESRASDGAEKKPGPTTRPGEERGSIGPGAESR